MAHMLIHMQFAERTGEKRLSNDFFVVISYLAPHLKISTVFSK